MFLWTFILSGTLCLTLLNPPYTAMLVSRSILHDSRLLLPTAVHPQLARRVPDAHLLPQSPWLPRSNQHNYLALSGPPHGEASAALVRVPGSVFPVAASGLPTTLPWTWCHLLLHIILCSVSCGALLCSVLFALILMVACWIINRLRVPQPGSPALEFVESLRKEIRGQALTSSSSLDGLCSGSSSNNSDTESDIVPTFCGLAIFDGLIIVTQAALDTVPAVPMRLHPPSPPQSDDLDLLQVSSHGLGGL
ncbi:hypothetical protein L227DRAFT_131716 [Lentinus tigrinus ALCF2SS1-6]|uniref:Uncharacterized protein n=1 Tax=Lentinus tigrinus ALCF2SS1-6 TaxID=1328759 RepID=A0A5C2SZT6_9APHY|nr:hypothetical protein L227DRAFT_131716 [Lentinus tigrinus ALCF2SS1-6]